jgi:GntR family transcriptional regulator
MFLTLDADDKRAIYQQIVDGIKALIARGELREGMPLPSVRQVAADLGVNLNTIAIAYRQLQEEGFATVRHGAGTVVSARRAQQPDQESLLRPLRSALTEWILAGFSDKEIAAAVQRELALARRNGDRR